VKFCFIQAHAGEYAIQRMCRVLVVSKAGYYAWRKRRRGPGSARARADQELSLRIRDVHAGSRQTYGSPRVHAELRASGVRVGRKRVSRLMQQDGLRAKQQPRRRRPVGAPESACGPEALDRVRRAFGVEEIGGRDRVWAADMTYVPTSEGWLYLAVVLDLASRLVVGWAMGASPDSELATAAVEMARLRRQPEPGVIHHSDRGSAYRAALFQAHLEAHGVVGSMSRRGNCYDNAVVESFFATVERELILGSRWSTRERARQALFEYIEVWYNRQRRHSSLGYCTPEQYDQQLALSPRAA
jgi:putative transposase